MANKSVQARKERYNTDPDFRTQILEQNRLSRERHRNKQVAKQKERYEANKEEINRRKRERRVTDDEYREEQNRKQRIRLETNPAAKETKRKCDARRYALKGADDNAKRREKYHTDAGYREQQLKRSRERLARNGKHINAERRSRHATNPLCMMVQAARRRAKLAGLPFDDEFMSNIQMPEVCPVLLIPLQVREGAKGAQPCSPTFDKLVPDRGYTEGNVFVISHLANRMKNVADTWQLLYFCSHIADYLNNTTSDEAMYYEKDKKHYSGRTWRNLILKTARKRAKHEGVEFGISVEDFLIPKLCPLTGIEIKSVARGEGLSNAASLDRVDPTRGYVRGNVRVISYLANSMKNNAPAETLMVFASNIPHYIGFIKIQGHHTSIFH